jgi:hypothetical protein
MIDVEKTNQLKNRIQREKSESPEPNNNAALANIDFLIVITAKVLTFYGAQWVLLTHFKQQPFNVIESILIFMTIVSTVNLSKK